MRAKISVATDRLPDAIRAHAEVLEVNPGIRNGEMCVLYDALSNRPLNRADPMGHFPAEGAQNILVEALRSGNADGQQRGRVTYAIAHILAGDPFANKPDNDRDIRANLHIAEQVLEGVVRLANGVYQAQGAGRTLNQQALVDMAQEHGRIADEQQRAADVFRGVGGPGGMPPVGGPGVAPFPVPGGPGLGAPGFGAPPPAAFIPAAPFGAPGMAVPPQPAPAPAPVVLSDTVQGDIDALLDAVKAACKNDPRTYKAVLEQYNKGNGRNIGSGRREFHFDAGAAGLTDQTNPVIASAETIHNINQSVDRLNKYLSGNLAVNGLRVSGLDLDNTSLQGAGNAAMREQAKTFAKAAVGDELADALAKAPAKAAAEQEKADEKKKKDNKPRIEDIERSIRAEEKNVRKLKRKLKANSRDIKDHDEAREEHKNPDFPLKNVAIAAVAGLIIGAIIGGPIGLLIFAGFVGLTASPYIYDHVAGSVANSRLKKSERKQDDLEMGMEGLQEKISKLKEKKVSLGGAGEAPVRGGAGEEKSQTQEETKRRSGAEVDLGRLSPSLPKESPLDRIKNTSGVGGRGA